MIFTYAKCDFEVTIDIGFISKMKSLAYFCLASWRGFGARFVRVVLPVALKPPRKSKFDVFTSEEVVVEFECKCTN